MWRTISRQPKTETLFFDEAIERVRQDHALRERADALLAAAAAQEPLIRDLLATPQSPHYHAEGPYVEDHLRLILMSLYAVAEGKLRLREVEEFARMKGYEGEVEELEQTLKEHVATFEVFAFCHDAGKWPTVSFTAEKGSRGHALGFNQPIDYRWEPFQISERAKLRERYVELYEQFADQHPNEPADEVQAQFFLAYGIDVHYPGHNRMIHVPVYRDLLERFAFAHRISNKDKEMLVDVISHHLQPLEDFEEVRPQAVRPYIHMANVRGWDGDDFIDMLQGALFLDAVCSSLRRSAHGTWHDMTALLNFFRSEQEAMPERSKKKREMREAEEQRRRNGVFRDVGLDGMALMELFQMEPGPEFGRLLRRVHASAIGKGSLPNVPPKVARELSHRITAFHSAFTPK